MKAIIAVNNIGFIGLNNGIPWKCKEDMKHFAKMTRQGMTLIPILCVGYNTGCNMTLKEREIKIDFRDKKIFMEGVDWCIGGKKTYEKYCHLFTELHISHIDDNTIGDCLFPDFTNLNKNCKIINYYFKTENNVTAL